MGEDEKHGDRSIDEGIPSFREVSHLSLINSIKYEKKSLSSKQAAIPLTDEKDEALIESSSTMLIEKKSSSKVRFDSDCDLTFDCTREDEKAHFSHRRKEELTEVAFEKKVKPVRKKTAAIRTESSGVMSYNGYREKNISMTSASSP